MTRIRMRAFALHMAFSCVLVAAFIYFFVRQWYPDGVLWLQGGVAVLLLMVFVDIVLGPLMTLFIFRPEAKSRLLLSLDMLFVVVVQLSAFGYAAWVIGSQRPIWMAYVYDRFYLVSADDLISGDRLSVSDLLSPRGRVAVAHVQLPWMLEFSGKGIEPGPEGGVPMVGAMPEAYGSFPRDMKLVRERAVHHGEYGVALENAGAEGCKKEKDVVVVRVVGRKASGFALLDDSGAVLCVLR